MKDWGEGFWGSEAWSGIQQPLLGSEPTFIGSPSFPFRFDDQCNLAKSIDDQSIRDNLRTSVFVDILSVPLNDRVGSHLMRFPFDPKDDSFREALADDIVDAAARGEPRAQVDELVRFVETEDSEKVSLVLVYSIENVPTPDFRTLELDAPSLDIASI